MLKIRWISNSWTMPESADDGQNALARHAFS
jgi:hypothetical protein